MLDWQILTTIIKSYVMNSLASSQTVQFMALNGKSYIVHVQSSPFMQTYLVKRKNKKSNKFLHQDRSCLRNRAISKLCSGNQNEILPAINFIGGPHALVAR